MSESVFEVKAKVVSEYDAKSAKEAGKKAGEQALKGMREVVGKRSNGISEAINTELLKGFKGYQKSFKIAEKLASSRSGNTLDIHLDRYKNRLLENNAIRQIEASRQAKGQERFSALLQRNKDYDNLFSQAILRQTKGEGTLTTSTSDLQDAFSVITKQLESSQTVGQKFGATILSLKDGFGGLIGAASKFAGIIGVIAPVVGKIASATWTITKGVAKTIYNATPISKIAEDVKALNKRLSTLSRQLIRIATYRAIRTLLKELTQGFKTGINNAYQWAKAVGEKFAPAMDALATSVQYLQNSLGALSANIIEQFSQAISVAIDKMAELISMLSMYYSMLVGKSYYYKATKAFKQYAAAVGQTLLGFDELNVLGGDSDSNYSSMFEKVATDAEAAIPTIQSVAEKINEFVANIDVEGFALKFSNIVNSVVSKINGFINAIDFQAMGKKIALGFNVMFDAIDPEGIGEIISQKLNIVIDLVKGFVENFEWGQAGTWLSQVVTKWFESIKWDNLTKAVSTAINGVFDFAYNFLKGIDLVSVAETLGDKFNKLIEDIDWVKVGQVINECIIDLVEATKKFLETVDWYSVGTKIGEMLGELDWWTIFKNVVSAMWTGLKGAFNAIMTAGATSTWDKNLQSTTSAGVDIVGTSNTKKKLLTYANGGTPDVGSLFWAGENGAELITQVGGRSTVYNEEQLGNSLAYANEGVISAINTLIGVVQRKSSQVTISASDIRKAVNNSSMRVGV